jgi:hypothetical protein
MSAKKTGAVAGAGIQITTDTIIVAADADNRHVSSQAVSWWPVHEFVQAHLDRVGSWPTAGTPEWCALADDDPAKLAGVIDARQHWTLRVETCQEQLAQASRDISAAADWTDLARQIVQRNTVYIRRAS